MAPVQGGGVSSFRSPTSIAQGRPAARLTSFSVSPFSIPVAQWVTHRCRQWKALEGEKGHTSKAAESPPMSDPVTVTGALPTAKTSY